MAFFSNGSEAFEYSEYYCGDCVHMHKDAGCPCWTAHLLWGYGECNNDKSILHKMIPRNGTTNEKCLFYEKASPEDEELANIMKSIRKQIGLDDD